MRIFYLLISLLLILSCKKEISSSQYKEDSIHISKKIKEINNSYVDNPSIVVKRLDSLLPEIKAKKMYYHLLKINKTKFVKAVQKQDTIQILKIVRESDSISKLSNDPAVQATCYFIKAKRNIYFQNNNEAIKELLISADLSKNFDEVTYINCLGLLSFYSLEVMDYQTAESYQKKRLVYGKKSPDIFTVMNYSDLANIYFFQNNKELMKKYLDSADFLKKKLKLKDYVRYNCIKGNLEFLKKNYSKAISYYKKDYDVSKKMNWKYYPEPFISMMNVYKVENKIDSVNYTLKLLKPMENAINEATEVAINYYPIKVEYSTGSEKQKAMQNFLNLQKSILEKNRGLLSAKYIYEQEQKEQQKKYKDDIEQQKKKNIFLTLFSLILGLVLLNIIFYLSNKKNKLASNNKELKLNILNIRLDAIFKERNRISKELHDDLGATFTSISMATQMLKDFPEKSDKYLEVISNNSNRMSEKVNEIVWSLNSRNDNLGSLSAYIINFAKKFFEPTSIHLNIETDKTIEENHEKFVAADKRRMIFLTAKEILNNIMKHADAKNVVMKLILEEPNKFSIKIKDDGKGIALPENYSGNGLKNIAENIDNIKGECRYETSDNGTEFLISVKI